ncbi:hypothetical protein NL676_023840 [Syzygium grande]|nr:hypothetical protein NL676_023840 [Syzygium grande]
MENQPRLASPGCRNPGVQGLSSTRGPSTAQVLKVVMLILLGGVLLLWRASPYQALSSGSLSQPPLFVLFSPVLIPAALTIGLARSQVLDVGGISAHGRCLSSCR